MIEFSPVEVSAYYAVRVPDLKKARGRERRGPCPIHGGKNDNFAVNMETGTAYCHSQCQRGWDLIGLERELTGTDFITSLTTICSIVGRPLPTRSRVTREEWRSAQVAREREKQERIDVRYFADAATHLAEQLLEVLDSFDGERAFHTRLIADLRSDPRAVYLEWRLNNPETLVALIDAGRSADRRLQDRVLQVIRYMAQEADQNAA